MNIKSFIIGRNPNISQNEKAIYINDPTKKVSSNHCKVTFDGVNFFIEDLMSSNGTFVDRIKITKKTLITNNSSIYLGENYSFSLRNTIIQNDKKHHYDNSFNENNNNLNIENELKNNNSVFFNNVISIFNFSDSNTFFINALKRIFEAFIILFFLLSVIIIFEYNKVKSEVFNENLKFGLILFFVFVIITCVLCIILLLKKRQKLDILILSTKKKVFSSLLSVLTSTLGEIFGLFLVIIGIGYSLIELIILLFYKKDFDKIHQYDTYPILESLSGFIIYPMLGILIVLLFNFFSEKIKNTQLL